MAKSGRVARAISYFVNHIYAMSGISVRSLYFKGPYLLLAEQITSYYKGGLLSGKPPLYMKPRVRQSLKPLII